MNYTHNLKYLHPFIGNNLLHIIEEIQYGLPNGHEARLVSGYRTPEHQFALYRQGRIFQNGSWKRTGKIVTNLDGLKKRSRHNSLPATAFDIGIFKDGTYLQDSPLYGLVSTGTRFGLDWGGHWKKFKDKPHLEIPASLLFKNNTERDSSWLWQKYLIMAGTYNGKHDGYFGRQSREALLKATDIAQRIPEAWDKLFDRFGMLSAQ